MMEHKFSWLGQSLIIFENHLDISNFISRFLTLKCFRVVAAPVPRLKCEKLVLKPRSPYCAAWKLHDIDRMYCLDMLHLSVVVTVLNTQKPLGQTNTETMLPVHISIQTLIPWVTRCKCISQIQYGIIFTLKIDTFVSFSNKIKCFS